VLPSTWTKTIGIDHAIAIGGGARTRIWKKSEKPQQ